MKGGGRSCCVVGCKNRTTIHGKHFYKFPKKQRYRDVWTSFTRRGNDFDVKDHSTICQDHFLPTCFNYKKKQVRLFPDSVPTVFERETSNGVEEIVLTFDPELLNYVESETFLNPAYDKEKHENDLIQKQKKRLAEVNRACRFCFEDPEEDDKDFVEISKLKNYSIRPGDVFTLIGLKSTQHQKMFSNVMCEECFQQIITFDGYKKRCCKAHNSIIAELKDLDKSLQKVRGTPLDANSWSNFDESWNHEDDFIHDESENNFDDIASPPKTEVDEYVEPSFQKVIIKEEAKDELMSDDEFLLPSINLEKVDSTFVIPAVETESGDASDCEKVQKLALPSPGPLFKDIYNPSDVSNVIKNQDRQMFATRIYECFFCRVVGLV